MTPEEDSPVSVVAFDQHGVADQATIHELLLFLNKMLFVDVICIQLIYANGKYSFQPYKV